MCPSHALGTGWPSEEQPGERIHGKVDQGAHVLSQDGPHLCSLKGINIDRVIDSANFTSSESHYSDDALPTVRMLDDSFHPMPDITGWCEGEKNYTRHQKISPHSLPTPHYCYVPVGYF